jgi:hypothetical protein
MVGHLSYTNRRYTWRVADSKTKYFVHSVETVDVFQKIIALYAKNEAEHINTQKGTKCGVHER